ncbi:MAG: response regulator [Gemmatimonadales bacterium]|nr:MAG: response regulator [Gemmatimonadales bacterium]
MTDLPLVNSAAERERRRRLLETIISSTPEPVCAFDLDCRCVFANEALLEVWGRTLEDALGRTFLELGYGPRLAEAHEREIAHVVATGRQIRGESTFPHATLGPRSWDYTFAPVLNGSGDVDLVAGTARDITALEARGAELRDSEERLRIVTEAAQIGLHDLDLPSGRVWWDRRTREFFGVGPETPITYKLWRACLHPDDAEGARAALRRAVDPEGEGRYRARYRVVSRRDGSIRCLEVTGSTTFVDGTATRVVGTAQDVTEQELAERATKEADRRKDEFIATLSHELRNPLAPIRMAASALPQVRHQPDRFDALVGIIERQTTDMSRLIDDLLDVSRITRGKIILKKERIDLAMLLAHAIEVAGPDPDRERLRFEVSFPERPITLEADPVRLSQVVSNLLSNAFKFTDRGSVHIAAWRDPDSDVALIRVEDTGPGIRPADQARIFEMFAQETREPGRSPTGGLGIGLPLVRMLVQLHDGEVSVDSAPGRGSSFTVRIPALPEEFSSAPVRGAVASTGVDAAGEVRRVLVVDDSPDVLHSVEIFLQARGHGVHTAKDGKAALEVGVAVRPEVVILDIGLPEMDGYEVARRIRRSAWGRDVELIAMTGWGQERDKEVAREAGFDHHLTKPVDPTILERLVAGVR